MPYSIKRISMALVATSLFVATVPAGQPDAPKVIRVIGIDAPGSILPGTTRAHREVTLGASFDARLCTVLVSEGTPVQRGDVLAKLDDRVAIASLELAREEAKNTARIDRAQAEVERSERLLDQTLAAYNGRGANSKEVQDARTNLAIAKADLAEASEQRRATALSVKLAEARLEEYKVRAPFDGVVLDIFSESGAVLRTGDPIVEIASNKKMRADIYLPASTALTILPGEAYAIELDEPVSRVLWARAVYAEPRIEPTSNTMRVVFNFETPDELIPAGVLVFPASREPNGQELAFARGEAENGTLATVEDAN